MIAYASTTGTKRNLQALHECGWRLLYAPGHSLPDKRFRFALDNGAWGAFNGGREWDEAGFVAALERYGNQSDWIVAPDIVGDGVASLAKTLSWLPRLRRYGMSLIAVQDGTTADMVSPHIGPSVGIFLGGSTEWKLATMGLWGEVARGAGCYYHVGRVNTVRRLMKAKLCGASSIDGTSVTRFSKTIGPLDAALKHPTLELHP